MARTAGAKNKAKSTRKQSQSQKKQQVEKCKATKARRKEAKLEKERKAAEEKLEKERKAREAAKKNFVGLLKKNYPAPYSHGDDVTIDDEDADIDIGTIGNTNDDVIDNENDETTNGDGGTDNIIGGSTNDGTLVNGNGVSSNSINGREDGVVVINNPTVSEIESGDVTANLDFDDEAASKKGSDDCSDDKLPGIQQAYVEAIQKRLQSEVSKDDKNSKNLWLLEHLRGNNWWIRRCHAKWVVKRLGIKRDYLAYYRDVYVWLPDVMWPDKVKNTFMPCCPNCKTNDRVGPHCFRSNHFGRLVVDLHETYYVISRRYICYECQEVSQKAKVQVEAFAEENNVSADIEVDEDASYTFMGWDERILPLFRYGRGNRFPAYLTWRAGVDKKVVNMMRSMYDAGVRPGRLSTMMVEWHSQQYTDECLNHEYEIQRLKESTFTASSSYQPLSDFGDKLKYRGTVPTGKYLLHVYKKYHKTIRPHLIKEVKKRGAQTLHWDVSYKEAKHLCQYRGQSVFKGLVTALNEIGEVRIQFHVYTDSQEQMTSALEAFKGTTSSLGLPGLRLFYTDNPVGDQRHILSMIPSLAEQQKKFDELSAQDSTDPSSTTDSTDLSPTTGDKPFYDHSKLRIRIVSDPDDINHVINAMMEDMNENEVGLDAEWNILRNAHGYQTGRSKVMTIQIAYRSSDNVIQVVVIKTGKLSELPNRLQTFLCNDMVIFAGNKVSADLKYIGDDFHIEQIKALDQKKRTNVCNLGMYARKRDVVQNAATCSIELLGERLFGVQIDKTLQTSDWNDPTDDQLNYAAIDAAVSLESYEVMKGMPDLSRRLTVDDIQPGKKVDLVPRSGDVSILATRAATAVVMDMLPCQCPSGIVPKTGKGKMVRAGEGSCVIEIEKIHSPGFIIPNFVHEKSGDAVCLGDIGKQRIVVPIAMLRDHHNSKEVRATPSQESTDPKGVSKPASKRVPSGRLQRPLSEYFDYTDGRRKEPLDEEIVEIMDDASDDHDESSNDEYFCWEDYAEEETEESNNELTSDDISRLHAAIFQSEEAQNGRALLQCEGLSEAPKPEDIKEKYSCILGDIFHAMNRTKVPVKHEAKKGYFNALQNAFLVWNPKKLKQLEDKMRENGMSDEEIKAQRYFNSHVYRGCVERYAPSPKILYWRVRAVYALFGKMIDSKTNKPLFNAQAWKKANNVLREILCGFYSDPPGFNMYTMRLRSDGMVMKNKYGMNIIECSRGTNRTEAYHKSLVTTFGTWHTGVEMSDYLLAERRHRHNHKVSEKRRFGFPKIGHFDTWKIDQLQNLYLENHGVQLYPNWTNASDYKCTDESFDTVALHHADLHAAMEERYKVVGDVKLTGDQLYMCEQMGIRYPFLPFCHKEEKKQYAKYELQKNGPVKDCDAAVEWIQFVDGQKIHAKLPSQIRSHVTNVDRNQRVKECLSRAKNGMEFIDELNKKISPVTQEDLNDNIDFQTETMDMSSAEEDDSGVAPLCNQPPVQQPRDPTRATTQLRLLPAPQEQSLTIEQPRRKVPSYNWPEPSIPPIMPHPTTQATRTSGITVVGGFSIGAMLPPKPKAKTVKHCKRCKVYGDRILASTCSGRGGQRFCKHFNDDGTVKTEKPKPTHINRRCSRCVAFKGNSAHLCSGRGGVEKCVYFTMSGYRVASQNRSRP